MVVAQRRRIVEEVDNKQDEDEEVDEQELIARLRGPSTDAIAKFEDCSRLLVVGRHRPPTHHFRRDTMHH
jgi:hypothetical protein